jgi:sarcosine oxidase subunit beta
MSSSTADVVICGAGIAGISAAYQLAVRQGIRDVVLVDERPPLSLTSDKSTECYRNWWPGPGQAMVGLMNRSIDLLEDLAEKSNNAFHMSRRGYLYVTADPERIHVFEQAGLEAEALGAGKLRRHAGRRGEPPYLPSPPTGFRDLPDGADLISSQALIHEHFPYLSHSTCAVLHARRCGWFSAQQLGAYLLEQARQHGVKLVQGRIDAVEVQGGRMAGVAIAGGQAQRHIACPTFVAAAGPLIKHVVRMMGVELPVFCEYHTKIAFADRLGAVPRHAPLLIWTDPQQLPWSEDERLELAADAKTAHLLGRFPSGVHTRPEGPDDSLIALILWTYHTEPVEPVIPPPPSDPAYPEIAMRGLSSMLPAMQAYFERPPRPIVDGGYYTKTAENRPLIGRLPVEGTYIIGALSGFGLMASQGAADLLGRHIGGLQLPAYAQAFSLDRYNDSEYQALLENWGDSGQL